LEKEKVGVEDGVASLEPNAVEEVFAPKRLTPEADAEKEKVEEDFGLTGVPTGVP